VCEDQTHQRLCLLSLDQLTDELTVCEDQTHQRLCLCIPRPVNR